MENPLPTVIAHRAVLNVFLSHVPVNEFKKTMHIILNNKHLKVNFTGVYQYVWNSETSLKCISNDFFLWTDRLYRHSFELPCKRTKISTQFIFSYFPLYFSYMTS